MFDTRGGKSVPLAEVFSEVLVEGFLGGVATVTLGARVLTLVTVALPDVTVKVSCNIQQRNGRDCSKY